MQESVVEGWKYASKQLGTDAAAQVGNAYVESVDGAIDELLVNLEELGRNGLGEKQLKGFVAEYWHAGTFNIDAALKGSKHRAFVDASTDHASVDVSTNFRDMYSLKYIRSYDESVKAQAKNVFQAYREYLSKARQREPLTFDKYIEKYHYTNNNNIRKLVDDYHKFVKGDDSSLSLEEFIKLNSDYDITTLLTSVYNGQNRLIPSDQLQEAIKYLERKIATESGKESANRIALLNNYKETLEKLVDRVSDGNGVESIPLTREEAEAIATLIKDGDFNLEDFGLKLSDLITTDYIIQQSLKAGYTAAVITLVMQLAPEIVKAFEHLIRNGRIDIDQLKRVGITAISASSEGFLRGFISSSLTIACNSGKLGEAFMGANPHVIAAITVIAIDVAKNSVMLAAGKITSREMGYTITKELVISSVALAGGTIGQAIVPELPVLGYMLGSLVGSCLVSVTLNVTEKFLISYCVDTGFTCFGLVEQNYKLPDETLKEMGISLSEIQKAEINMAEIQEIQVNHIDISHTQTNEIKLVMVRRGVIGINKIGYV